MEDLAYRRMLDMAYDSEKPLPCEISRIAKLIGLPQNQSEIREVLCEFWEETSDGWVDNRVSKELDKYHSKAELAKANGKLGGRPKKPNNNPEETQSVILDNPEETGSQANHKPLTINQETDIKDIDRQAYNTLLENGFNHVWKVFKDCKARINKTDTSPKLTTFDKNWKKHFNTSYFKNNSEQDYKSEVNKIADFIKQAHAITGFNRFENMQLAKLLSEKQWND